MIRVVIYLVVVGALAGGAVWLADRPGDVLITWQNRRIETSVMVLVVVITTIAVLAVMLWTIVRAILRAPDILWLYLRTRRGVRGYLAVSQGLIAIGSGDARAARKYADEANRIAPTEPLTLLLNAQASQLAGDREAAERTFHVMACRDDTRLLGLHGLFVEAQRRDDVIAARFYAEEAAKRPPGSMGKSTPKGAQAPAWAGLAVFDARCAAGDWTGALERLDHNMKAGLVDRAAYRRQRAVLLTARAIAAEERAPAEARELALDAVKFAPTLVPAAALAGRLLGEAGDLRRARLIVEAAWKANPHPDLADTYAHLRPGDSARDRLARVESLAQTTPGNIEGALAVARAALDAQEFARARAALVPLAIVPTQRVAMLMAEIEETEHGDEGRARAWMTRALQARRDPAWTADGLVADRWMPVSPVTGRLDAFQWKDPLAELGGDVVEGSAKDRLVFDVPRPARPPEAPEPRSADSAPDRAIETPRISSRRSAARVAPVIPLVQVPDDPGPEPEPQPEPAEDKASDGWRRLRGMFR